jgi:hypothetical protein
MMSKIDQRQLFNTTIEEPEGLSDLLGKLFPNKSNQFVPRPIFAISKDVPPILLYTESRREDNWLDSFSYYGGNGQAAQIRFGARESLELNTKIIGESERGKILNAFCRVEFCLDVFICIYEGIFENKTTWAALSLEFEKEGGKYTTTSQKITALKQANYIRTKTRKLLEKSKQIRNILAHQYMPEVGVGLSQVDVERYESVAKAVELIFDAAWVELLKDYIPHELIIAQWLREHTKEPHL